MTWPVVAISEVAQIVGGSTPSRTKPHYWDGEIAWATPKDLSNLEGPYLEDTPQRISQAGFESCSTYLLPKGSVLLSSRAPIGLVAITGREMCTNQGFKSFVLKGDIDSLYLYHFLKKNRSSIEGMGSGSTFKEISKAATARLQIPLPPLDIQKKIAAVLDKADSIRRKRKQVMAKLDELLQSVFLDMFGDPVTNPKGWEVKKLGEVCTKITDGTHHSPTPQSSGVPYVTAQHIKPYRIEFRSKATYVSPEAHAAIYNRCNPEKGDVLYIKDGVTTGIAAINDWDVPFSMLSSLALLKVDQNLLTPHYLCGWLNNPRVKQHLKRNMAGAAITRFTLNLIKGFDIPTPHIDMQIRWAEFMDARLKSERIVEDLARSNDNLFNSLLQRAFKGELEFNERTQEELETV